MISHDTKPSLEVHLKDIHQYFDYHSDGYLIEKTIRNNKQRTRVGERIRESFNSSGYKQIKYKKRHVLLHRAIFYFHHKFLPKYVDHINGSRTDNRIENLRECTQSQNVSCSGARKKKMKCVFYEKRRNLFCARTTINKKNKHIGYFKTEKEAAIAYNNYAKEMLGEFAFLNEV